MTDQRRTVRVRLLQELDQWITGLRSLEASLDEVLSDDVFAGDGSNGDVSNSNNGRCGGVTNMAPPARETPKAENRFFGSPSFFVARKRQPEKPQSNGKDAPEIFAFRDSLLRRSPFDNEPNDRPRIAARFDVRRSVAADAGIRTYDCTDTTSGRPVSVRVVDPRLRDIAVRAFDTEQHLSHPQIASASDYGELVGGGTYFVLASAAGGVSLKAISTNGSRRPSSWEALFGAARKACAGVAYAHRHGVVHGALRPGSVFVLDDGHVVVADWCFASRAGEQRPGWVALKRELGLEEYLAPEELEREPASPRADVYCLGVMLYELLTGRTPLALGRRHTGGSLSNGGATRALLFGYTPPPPSRFLSSSDPNTPTHSRDLPDRLRELDAIILRCLEKDPSDRFDDAGELLDALEGI